MKGPVWTTYNPPSQDWLEQTKLSDYKLRFALIQLCGAAQKSLDLELETYFDMLFVADELIGHPHLLGNKHLGRVLHMRDFMIKQLWEHRRCVKVIRRWDRRMIEKIPK